MNAAPPDPMLARETSWSAWRWISCIALAFLLHLGLIYLLGEPKPAPTRPVKNAAALQATPTQTELQQLDDPTLFALPHPRGFAAATWLRLPKVGFAPFRWTEPPRLLPLPMEQLGAIFLRLAETSPPAIREIAAAAAPVTTVLPPPEIETGRRSSTLRVNGALTGRPFRNAATNLPLQPALDGLTNTVVQVLVDARGQVISATLTPPGSGLKEADQTALKLARNVRFAALKPAPKLTVGRLIFEWQTLPATNAPGTPP